MVRTLMLLGAAAFQLPPIWYAREKKYRIITCDDRPDNPGHALADSSYNVSTLDVKRLLKIAQQEKIDGILSYASDISMTAMAQIAQQLGIPGPSLETVNLLCDKAQFRKFLREQHLQRITCESFDERKKALEYALSISLPLVTKPCDRSGSLAVTVVRSQEQLGEALEKAFAASLSGRVIVETFVEKQGAQLCGDGFMHHGRLAYVGYGDGVVDNHLDSVEPIAEMFPSTHEADVLHRVGDCVQDILLRTGYEDGPFNLDVRIQPNGMPFVIEIGPRAGGNFIPEAIKHHSGYPMTAWTVELALGQPFDLDPSQREKCHPFVASFMSRADQVDRKLYAPYELQTTLYTSSKDKYYANILMAFNERVTMESVVGSLVKLNTKIYV